MSDLTKYLVHRFYSEKYDERVLYKGTEEQCIEYINKRPADEQNEIVEIFPGEPYYNRLDGEL